ncbi:MAG: MATE family efflux transporter [Eubacteriales bacterium]|nr:MATE family efflux transporter [Eubacteriales bacterium]
MIHDMTKDNPVKVMSAFAVPLFIGSVFQQVYNMVDSIVVGNFVGYEALAAVGACGGPFNLIIALLTGLTGGTSVVMAQYFGAKDSGKLKETFTTAILVNGAVGILLTILGFLVTRPLLMIMRTPEELLDKAVLYMTIMCAGILVNCMYNGMSAVLRALGDSITPLVVLVIASLLNVVLDLLFVVGFHMGVAGVAVATVLAQAVSAVFCFLYTIHRIPELRFRFRDLRINRKVASDIIRIGVPSALSSSGVSISVIFMQTTINGFGAMVVAAYTIGNRAEQIGMCLAYSIGISVGTFCGQNIGAKRMDRVKEGMRIGCIIAVVYAAVVSLGMILFAAPLAGIFSQDQEVIGIAVEVIYVTMLFGPMLGLVFVFQNFLRSAGDVAPTVWMSVTEIVARSILAFVFASIWGRIGIWWATPVGWTASLLIGILRYRNGNWKKKQLIA